MFSYCILHARADLEPFLQASLTKLRELFPNGHFTLGREDFEKNFQTAGGWAAWIEQVALGVDYSTRKPTYDAFVVLDRHIGKATYDMLVHALTARKVVYLLENDTIFDVVSVTPYSETYQQFGRVIVKGEY